MSVSEEVYSKGFVESKKPGEWFFPRGKDVSAKPRQSRDGPTPRPANRAHS